MQSKIIIIGVVILIIGAVIYFNGREFPIPRGEAIPVENGGIVSDDPENTEDNIQNNDSDVVEQKVSFNDSKKILMVSTREIFTTDGVKHSIPLNEILSGGPGKDGIPSIDNPKFDSIKNSSFLLDSDIGLGLTVGNESRFYPYRILVWHEIVNDNIGGKPILVTYCPLCATGIVFDRTVNGEAQEFGVSGKLWQSNLLMYNRAENEADESLWSQVLGEAVLGIETGERLSIVRSDVVKFSDWKNAHPNTLVLSRDTGELRNYGLDPYEGYYTSESVSFGATFSDTRLHPKTLVHGIEINGSFKAYSKDALKEGITEDTFEGKKIIITRNKNNELIFTADEKEISSITGFWFSWIAVHPETKLFK